RQNILDTRSNSAYTCHHKTLMSLPRLKPADQGRGEYRFPSVLTVEDGTSNKQFGQKKQTISSCTQRGHRICLQSSQYSKFSRGKSEKLERGARGSKVSSSSSDSSGSSSGAAGAPGLVGDMEVMSIDS